MRIKTATIKPAAVIAIVIKTLILTANPIDLLASGLRPMALIPFVATRPNIIKPRKKDRNKTRIANVYLNAVLGSSKAAIVLS